MSQVGSVRVTVTVAVEPAAAFEVFTEEIGQWYRAGLSSLVGHDRPDTLRFEGGVGGRLLECDGTGAEEEQGRVTVWAPGERLVFVDTRATEVEVTFAPVPRGTRVVLEHRGLDRLPPDAAESVSRHSWKRLAEWFERYLEAPRAQPGTHDDDGGRV